MKLAQFFASRLGLRLLHADCYEVVHSWHPDCTRALLIALPDSALFCLRTYASLYLINELVKHRFRLAKVNWRKLVRDTLRSSLFLTTNLVLFLWWMCRLRHVLGFYTWPTIAFVNSVLACAMAIPLEAPKRRPLLALYLVNQASEAAFKQICQRLSVNSLPNAQWFLFAIGLALLFHHLESTPRRENRQLEALFSVSHGCGVDGAQWWRVPLRNFGAGVAFNSVMALMRYWRKGTWTVVKSVGRRDFWRLPAFLALMPAIFKASRHLFVSKLTQTALSTHSATVSGLLSGAAMAVYPNTNIAMLTLWKGLESWLRRYSPFLPSLPHADSVVYALAAGYILGVAVLEPQALRPSYLKFLTGLTGQRLLLFNRALMQREFGFPATQMLGGEEGRLGGEGLERNLLTRNPDFYLPLASANQ